MSVFHRRQSSYSSNWKERSSRKRLAWRELSKKLKNMSKMILGALFETFWSQYQIFPYRNTYLAGLGHISKGSTIHMNWFQQKHLPVEEKVWPWVNWEKKKEKLKENKTKKLWNSLRCTLCNFLKLIPNYSKLIHLSLGTCKAFLRSHTSYESIQAEGSTSRSQSVSYSKLH